ncbi:MAG: dockerin type I domain-containing protein [Aureliella sp.]
MKSRKLLGWERLEGRRLLTVGSLMPNFADSGLLSDSSVHQRPLDDSVAALTLNPDGGYYVASRLYSGRGMTSVTSFDSDGNVKPEFGDGGSAVVRLSSENEWASLVAVQPDGKVLVAGHIRGSNSNATSIMAIRRLHPDGSDDITFGDEGRVATGLGLHVGPKKMVVRPTGEILILYQQASAIGLLQLNSDGTLDNDFADNGDLRIPLERAYAGDLLLLDTGEAILSGSEETADNEYDATLFKASTNGTLDSSFASNASFPIARNVNTGFFSWPLEMAQQSNGNIVVASTLQDEGTYDLQVRSFSLDGRPVQSFANSGVRSIVVDGRQSTAIHDIHVLEDDSIVASGYIRDRTSQPRGTATFWVSQNGALEQIVRDTIQFDTNEVAGSVVIGDRLISVAASQERESILSPEAAFDQDIQAIAFDIASRGRDTTFGTDGVQLANVFDQYGNTVALQSIELFDHSLLVLQQDRLPVDSNQRMPFFLAKYSEFGVPDLTYGDNGKLHLGDIQGTAELLNTPAGKFVIFESSITGRELSVVRITEEGQIDTSFGDQGWISYEYGNLDVQDFYFADNAIYIAGLGSSRDQYFVRKLNYSGAEQTEFGEQGELQIPVRFNFSGSSIRLQQHGSEHVIAMVGNHPDDSSFSVGLFRFSMHGVPDEGFGTDGYVGTRLSTGKAVDGGRGLIVLPDESIVLFGMASSTLAIEKLTSNGFPDPFFANDGILRFSGIGVESIQDYGVDSEGRLVVLRAVARSLENVTLVTRVTPEGEPDREFGEQGTSEFQFGEYGGVPGDLTIGNFDDLLLTGYRIGDEQRFGMVARVIGGLEENTGWHNAGFNMDTNGDQFASALDALLVINFLNQNSGQPLDGGRPRGEAFVDINNDGFASPLDALFVINFLNNSEGEGESKDSQNWESPSPALIDSSDQEWPFASVGAPPIDLRRR